ncbi:MAG: DNA polymerase III subunit beta [Limisphaerales bacterium]|nr:MAG: DNA polymerase III subunit beta [Limisphaerales bacterium]
MNPVIELPAAELKTALTGLGKIISKRTTLPVLEHLRVTRTGNGVVIIEATDLDSTARYQVEQPSEGAPCDFLVPFHPLNQMVKGGKEPVLIGLEPKNKVRLKTYVGNSAMEQTLDTLPLDEFPPTPATTSKPISLDATFRDSFREALDCCSDDSSRHVIHHVCLDTRNKEGHYLAATDGRHLYAANSFSFDLKEPVLIPDRPFLRWNKFMEDGAGELSTKPKTAKQGSWLQLKSGRWTFITKGGDEEFPNWKQVVPAADSHRTQVRFDNETVATLLAGLPKLPYQDEFHRGVTVEVAGTMVCFKAKAKDAKDWTKLTLHSARILGKSVSIALNREFVLKALRYGLATLEIQDDLSPVVFSEGGRRMVVMPLRPDGAAAPAQPSPVPQATEPPTSAPNPQPNTNSNPPVAEQPQAQPQPTSTMPKDTQTNPTEAPTETSPVKAVIQHIDNIKESLLKQLEKEKKASDKEMDSVREKLREIQAVRI